MMFCWNNMASQMS